MTKNRLRVEPAWALAAVLSALAIHSTPVEAGRIVMLDPFPPTAGWAMETDDAFSLMRAGCLEGLTRIDFDQKLQPSLATTWEQSNPTDWDFSIRPGVRFHDGRDVDAAAVVNSLDRVLNASAPSRAFNPKVISKVEAIDEMTVRISTPTPSVLLPLRLASANTGILSPASYVDQGKVDPVDACTGPFVVKKVLAKQLLGMVRNDDYWGGEVGVEEAEVHYVTDGNTRVTQLRSGEAQIATKIPLAVRASLENMPEIVVHSLEVPRTTAMYLNNGKPPLDNPLVRKAIQAAVDVSAIVASAYEGIGTPAIGPFAPHEPWAPEVGVVEHDPDRAIALLAEAGIEPGDLKFELRAYNSRPELPDVAQIIQHQLKAVGIDVAVIITDWAGLEPSFVGGTYDMAMMSRGHQLDVADPLGFLQADYSCEGGFNVSHVCNPEIDALLEDAAAMADNDSRFDHYRSVARWLQEEAVNVFIVHQQETNATHESVRNFRVHPLNHYYLTKDITLDE